MCPSSSEGITLPKRPLHVFLRKDTEATIKSCKARRNNLLLVLTFHGNGWSDWASLLYQVSKQGLELISF